MWGLSIAFLVIAAACVHWLKRSIRSRGVEIPCTTGALPVVPIAIGVGSVLAMAGGSGAIIAWLHLFGAGPFAYTVYLLSMCAASVSLILAVATAHTNRVALARINLSPPNRLVVRTPDGTNTFALENRSVRVSGVASGIGGRTYVQYFIAAGERTLHLVVPISLRAARVTEGAPWIAQPTGAVVQDRFKEVHRFLEPFCALPEPGTSQGLP